MEKLKQFPELFAWLQKIGATEVVPSGTLGDTAAADVYLFGVKRSDNVKVAFVVIVHNGGWHIFPRCGAGEPDQQKLWMAEVELGVRTFAEVSHSEWNEPAPGDLLDEIARGLTDPAKEWFKEKRSEMAVVLADIIVRNGHEAAVCYVQHKFDEWWERVRCKLPG